MVHIYDPLHLIRRIRNNLSKHDLAWLEGGQHHVASWCDIEKAFAMDNTSGELCLMPKLSEYHTNPKKIRKMKVACGTQVFNHTATAVINLLATSGMDLLL